MKVLRLKGKTQRGKNRVHNNGEMWTVEKGESRLQPAKILISAVKNGYNCWIEEKNDPDMEIVG